MSASTRLRIAVVGCGAVSRANLLPALAGHDGLTIAGLVDRDLGRATDLASAYGVARAVTSLDEIIDDVDGVILATPPAHHAKATTDIAALGRHVFVEKPMAITLAEAEAMVEAADRHGVVLSVGLYRRVLPSVRLLRALLERGEYGRPLAVDAEEGGPYGWQLATLDVLTRSGGGGGVLIDIGSHVLDLILHVLPGVPRLTRYQDNSRGGIETDCELRGTITTGGGEIPLRVELSRTRELRNSIRVVCEHATIELPRANFTELLVHSTRDSDEGAASPFRTSVAWNGQGPYVGYQAFRDEIDDWVSAIAAHDVPTLSGASVLPVVGLIEQCYRQRQTWPEPWTDEGLPGPSRKRARSKTRVLVTGAGGFVGARTVELLREQEGHDVVALVREPRSAARLACWPAEIVLGDVCSAADMARVMKGVDAVVHCAVGTSWMPDESRRVTVEGTRTAAAAALAAGVSRFVHISTLFVHQREGVSVIDEATPLAPPTHDNYGQAKLAAERALAELAGRGLSTIVLRPTRIYGPHSKTFTVRPLQALGEGRLAVGGDPSVPANMVYVDNVVEAIARAIDADARLSGASYLVTDPEQLTLQAFFNYFGAGSGATVQVVPAPVRRTDAARRGLVARWGAGITTVATSPEFRQFVRRAFETDPIGTWPRRFWEQHPEFQQKMLRRFGSDPAVVYRPRPSAGQEPLVYTGEPALVRGDKASTELGLAPAVPHARAMALTLEWAVAAKLVKGAGAGAVAAAATVESAARDAE